MINFDWVVPKRYIKLQLFSGKDNSNELLSELDINAKITFNTSESVSGATNEANIVINGILPDKMAFLATTSTQWIKEAVQNKIVIDAGYENNHAIVFSGIINEATPSLNDANYSITLKALAGFDLMLGVNKSYEFKGKRKASEIANTLANDLKFVFKNELVKDVEITDYHTDSMSIIDNIRNLADVSGLDIYTSNNILYIKNKGTPIKSLDKFIIDDTNMIGNIDITSQGANVKVLMNPALITGQEIQVKSKKFELINEQQLILQTLSHSGDTKGGDWISNLKLFRKDLLKD